MDNKGIYKIFNLVNNKIYIGSASSNGGFRKRWNEHKSDLNRNVHHNKHLQLSWNKYGSDNFKFEIIELINDTSLILEREQYYLDNLKPDYNICKIAGNTLGVKLSEEHKKKISDNAKLRIGDKNPFYGKKDTEETKNLMLKNKKGKPVKPKKPILQLNINNEVIKYWKGTYDVVESLGFNQSNINLVLNDKRKTAHGFKWVYVN
jgi:group I intron endonuclease